VNGSSSGGAARTRGEAHRDPEPDRPDPAAALAGLERALAHHRRHGDPGAPAVLSLTLAAVDGERALETVLPSARPGGPPGSDAAACFHGRDGTERTGWGAAALVLGTGADRFHQVAQAASGVLATMPRTPVRPVALGGLAFTRGSAGRAPWEGFGDARFVIPRFLLVRRRHARDAELALLLAPGERLDRQVEAHLIEDAAHLLDALHAPAPSTVPAELRIDHLSRSAWEARVRDVLDAIASGAFEKIVAARRSVVSTGDPGVALHPADALARLRVRYPTCTRFALRPGADAGTFLGATPERLVARRGHRVETEALAGSRPAGLDEGALLESAKDVAEHAPVVRLIRERLAPFCDALRVSPAPELERLPNVVHIRTDIEGVLDAPTHVLTLAEALHPTPAVGGVPGDAAVAWIARHEEHPRGWYAGPFGWFDAAGEGELVVALRSGLLRGSDAFLYAGGGIVAGSDPAAEHAETVLKLRPMLDALGAGPAAPGSDRDDPPSDTRGERGPRPPRDARPVAME